MPAALRLFGGRLQERFGRDTPTPGDAATLPLGSPSPHTVVDAVAEGVFVARGLDGAVGAEAAGGLHADAIAGEERRGGLAAAQALRHPLFGHGTQPPRSVHQLNGPKLMEVPFLYDGSDHL